MKTLIIIVVAIPVALLLMKRKDMTWRQSILKTIYPVIMLKGKLFPGSGDVQLNKGDVTPHTSFYTLKAIGNNGTEIDFAAFKGKKVLIVNTASDCGYTGQYEELEKLHQQYKDSLVILGFPANDFKEQEKKDNAAIAEFCKINYGVTFQLMQKSHVIKGAEQNAVFQWLSQSSQNGWCDQQPLWNFSKYIINEEGKLIAFFSQNISPVSGKVITEIGK